MYVNLKVGVVIASFALFLLWGGARGYAAIMYNLNIGNYIARAATSPNPAVAVEELDKAIASIEQRGIKSGNTGIFFSYPENDVGFWYKRLTDSRQILRDLPPNDSPLEISNTMIRVHETLVVSDKDGQHIIEPEGISIFPYNVLFAWWGSLSAILTIAFSIWAAAST